MLAARQWRLLAIPLIAYTNLLQCKILVFLSIGM